MGVTGRIGEAQNSERCLALQRAIRVAHGHAQRANALSLVVSLVVAALSVPNKFLPGITGTVTVIGVLWAAGYALFVSPWSDRYLRTSASLQEMFDVAVFNLPWNSVTVGDRVPDDEVSRLSRRFRGDERALRDYYLAGNVPAPYDVLFCLEQNLAWGSRVRRRFADLLVALVLLWAAVGVVIGIGVHNTVGDLVTGWFVPSLGLLLVCLDTYDAQVSITLERDRVLGLVRAIYDDPGSPVLASEPAFITFARQIQDVLFQLRRQQPRVPNWFFRHFHDKDLADFRYKMHALEASLGNSAPLAS